MLSSGAEAELLALAEKLDIPVCASMMGLGGFPPRHRLWLGMVGMHGTLAANRAARECDVLLVCGARFSDRVAGSRTGFAPNAQVIHVISTMRNSIKMSPPRSGGRGSESGAHRAAQPDRARLPCRLDGGTGRPDPPTPSLQIRGRMPCPIPWRSCKRCAV